MSNLQKFADAYRSVRRTHPVVRQGFFGASKEREEGEAAFELAVNDLTSVYSFDAAAKQLAVISGCSPATIYSRVYVYLWFQIFDQARKDIRNVTQNGILKAMKELPEDARELLSPARHFNAARSKLAT